MTKLRRIMLELFVLALLVTTSAVSWGQLSVGAQEGAKCEGLMCTEQQDCGSKCFCNRPSTTCILDAMETQ